MESFLNDFKYAWRGLRKSPGITIIAVIALSLGIGLTTVMFSITYGALHRGLPFEGADRILHLERANPSQDITSMELSIHDFRDWDQRQRSFETLAAFYQGTVNIRGTERPERYDGAFITHDLFEAVGVQPILGRMFTAEEERSGSQLVAVLGYKAWQESYGGSRDVIGTAVTINGEPGEIIGVMPEDFRFPLEEEVWVPLRMDDVALARGTGQTLEGVGLLREGITDAAAMVEFSGIAAQLAAEYPEANEGVTAVIKPYTEEFIGEEETSILYAMLLTVIMVLIIACANVANLLLARAAVRTRDLAIRTAMGAERWRVIVQLLSQAAVLTAMGALIGTGIAWVGITMFDRAVSATDPPFWLVFKLDAPIFAFVIGIAGLAALVAGIIPAIKASGADVNSILKDDSRGSSSLQIGRLSRWLVVAEVAMSMALLVASGLMVKGVVKLNNEDYGFPMEDVFTARIGVFEERFPDAESRLRFWDQVEERVAQLPGVASAAMTANLPGTGSNGARFGVDGESYEASRDMPIANFIAASPNFQEVFEVEVLQGRWFERTDAGDASMVAVVNERFVERYFPDGQAIGRRIRMGGLESQDPWREIVGVVPNYRIEGVGNADPGEEIDRPGFYLPIAQQDLRFMSVAARVAGAAPLSIAAEVRDAVAGIDADTPIYFVQTLRAAIDENLWFYRVFGTLFLVFGAAALFMASVGLYGVMSFSVHQRVGEMGIRMALGAESGRVLRMVLKQGLGQILIGVAIGAVLAVFVARGLTLILYQVEPFDPVTFVSVMGLLTLTGILASMIPARRATQVDPMVALRKE